MGQPGTPVSISLNQDEISVVIDIHNEGNPIPKNEQAILFEQFKRAKKIESSSVEWGIGLTIVQGIISAHRGTIKVESSQDKGTSFIINFPKDNSLSA